MELKEILSNKYIMLSAYIIIINLISYISMYKDKKAAKNYMYRTPEKTLFTLAFFGGALGIHLGMYKFRHKTKHMSFKILIPILFILNIISIYYLLTI